MSDYTPKRGDRVKVTLEGEVGTTYRGGFHLGAFTYVSTSVSPGGRLTTEVVRLPDPEPEWKTHTVVQVEDLLPVVYTGLEDGWRFPAGYGGYYKNADALVSHAWQDGTLKILWQPEDAEW